MSNNIKIFLPEGSEKSLPANSTGFDLANSIGKGLAKSAVAYKVDETQYDLSDQLKDNAQVSIITIQSEEGRPLGTGPPVIAAGREARQE